MSSPNPNSSSSPARLRRASGAQWKPGKAEEGPPGSGFLPATEAVSREQRDYADYELFVRQEIERDVQRAIDAARAEKLAAHRPTYQVEVVEHEHSRWKSYSDQIKAFAVAVPGQAVFHLRSGLRARDIALLLTHDMRCIDRQWMAKLFGWVEEDGPIEYLIGLNGESSRHRQPLALHDVEAMLAAIMPEFGPLLTQQ